MYATHVHLFDSENLNNLFFIAKIDEKMQHRKVKSIAILVHSDETQFYLCSMDEKVIH